MGCAKSQPLDPQSETNKEPTAFVREDQDEAQLVASEVLPAVVAAPSNDDSLEGLQTEPDVVAALWQNAVGFGSRSSDIWGNLQRACDYMVSVSPSRCARCVSEQPPCPSLGPPIEPCH
ncbi:hypothetical protein HaLaN_16470 [Haematococcus lacustris]|uniref:Uncharacterized protein n=1 Tax=Haematococcus lacustris TaxID=44745 RepID=A0A699ZL31_HAELA|nr:hypothetical protein HaLaN_16470 [Haematococcus lacustris]